MAHDSLGHDSLNHLLTFCQDLIRTKGMIPQSESWKIYCIAKRFDSLLTWILLHLGCSSDSLTHLFIPAWFESLKPLNGGELLSSVNCRPNLAYYINIIKYVFYKAWCAWESNDVLQCRNLTTLIMSVWSLNLVQLHWTSGVPICTSEELKCIGGKHFIRHGEPALYLQLTLNSNIMVFLVSS